MSPASDDLPRENARSLAAPTAATGNGAGAAHDDAPLVVALAGDADDEGALRLARALAERTGAAVQLVTVLPPVVIPVDVAFTVMPPPPPELAQAQRDAQLALVRERVARALPGDAVAARWPLALEEGPPDATIARFAEAHAARVVVTGRGRHGLAGRLLGGETVGRLLRWTDRPVYAAEPDARGLARTVVVAVDFSAYGAHAARVALALVAPDARLVLAHVRPAPWPAAPGLAPDAAPWRAPDAQPVEERLAELRSALGAPAGMTVETVVREGGPAGHVLAELARERAADLVVCGTHGYGFLNRLVLGSVATELLRAAPCALLAVPGRALTHAEAARAAEAPLACRTLAGDERATALAAFSRRHVRRRCALGVTAPGVAPGMAPSARAFGEDVLEVSALPLASVVYEPGEAMVVLTFGPADPDAPRLTHVVADVTAIELLTDPRTGRDAALRITGTRERAVLRLL